MFQIACNTTLDRVAQRVREGGHPVPPERILAQAVRLADVAYLYDAMEAVEGGPRLVAVRTPTATTVLVDALPAWAQRMLRTC